MSGTTPRTVLTLPARAGARVVALPAAPQPAQAGPVKQKGSYDALHGAVVKFKSEAVAGRKTIRRLQAENAELKLMALGVIRTWFLFTDNYRARLKEAGIAEPEKILELATGLSAAEFAEWVARLKAA